MFCSVPNDTMGTVADGTIAAVIDRCARDARLVHKIKGEMVPHVAEIARRSGLSRGYISKLLNGESGKRPGHDVIRQLASAFGPHGRPLLAFAVDEPSTDTPFSELSAWVFETPAIRELLVARPKEVTVGDLLRFKFSPAGHGEFEATDAWNHMLQLRVGLRLDEDDGGHDVTPGDAARVPHMRGRKKPK